MSKPVDSVHGQLGLTVQSVHPPLKGGHGQSPFPGTVAEERIDLRALAVPPAPRPIGDISTAPKKRKAWVRSEETKAKLRANMAKAQAVESERRGVTRWYRISMAMADGEWHSTRDVWKRLPGVPLGPLSSALALMMRYGLVDRIPIPNAPPPFKRGKLWWRPGKWWWRLTPKGREHAREGRLRRLLE